MKQQNYNVTSTSQWPIKAWTNGVPIEDAAQRQLERLANMPFIYKWVAAMPDVHLGRGATIGSVIATDKAIIPAAVGVDIGCGMMAVQTTMTAKQLPDNLAGVRSAIERAVPHGRTGGGRDDLGGWRGRHPKRVEKAWAPLATQLEAIRERNPGLRKRMNTVDHLGTLGTGNHFIELCLDETDAVWVMLHSGSRGVGNAIGRHFIAAAKREMERWFIQLPDKDLAYIAEESMLFGRYMQALTWAQRFASENRRLMMEAVVDALHDAHDLPGFDLGEMAVNCHHNYVARETHYGREVLVTRKGAVRAGLDELGIIPGSMGARSYIVRGLGNAESFCSCSHGAGRTMSRTEARRRFTVDDHVAATAGVECRKDEGVIDETPMAYKSIEAVMAAQADLVQPIHTLRQVVCVKG
ncbi:MAG: tRNA-splicing ligase RtcB [Myxococcota bacterium]|jgi:tRNA-splicing ligase RtcB